MMIYQESDGIIELVIARARREERERIANLAADLVDEAGFDGESFRAALLKEARDE